MGQRKNRSTPASRFLNKTILTLWELYLKAYIFVAVERVMLRYSLAGHGGNGKEFFVLLGHLGGLWEGVLIV